MHRTLLAILLVGTLAGCTDKGPEEVPAPTSAECLEQGLILDEDAPGGPACVEAPFEIREFEDPNHPCVVSRQRDRVHAPDLVGDPWVQGQWWEYSLAIDGEAQGTTRLVYYDDQDLDNQGRPQHYMVGTVTREEALHHALFSVNPMIGRVHRVLYSPHESGDHADMFHFPLCDGSQWTTMFYGERFTLTARNASVEVPGLGPQPGFVIQGTSDDGGSLELSYVPAAQWFTYIDLVRADGATVRMDLEALGSGQAGMAYFLRAQQDEFVELSGQAAVPNAAGALAEQAVQREDGEDGPYDAVGVAVAARLAGTGTAILEIVEPGGEVAWTQTLDGQQTEVHEIAEFPYMAGAWTMRLRGGAVDAGTAAVEASFHVVSIYDRSGTV